MHMPNTARTISAVEGNTPEAGGHAAPDRLLILRVDLERLERGERARRRAAEAELVNEHGDELQVRRLHLGDHLTDGEREHAGWRVVAV